jgi:putative flippase GtrA
MRTAEISESTPKPDLEEPLDFQPPVPGRSTFWQFLRFGLVGCLNTLLDLLVLNCLLWLRPTPQIGLLVLMNSFAYAVGAFNSFVLNRYWTFQRNGRPSLDEVWRFLLVTLAGIVCNDLLLACVNSILQAMHLSSALWTNVAKLGAIGGTILISYLGMRLWVFVRRTGKAGDHSSSASQLSDRSICQSEPAK